MSDTQNKFLSRKVLIMANVIFLAVIFVMGFFLLRKDKTDHAGKITRDESIDYKFTNPILDYEELSSSQMRAIPFGSIGKKIDSIIDLGEVSHISLYYRDLNNGQWIGIGEKEEFSPASLLKVPVMIAFLKKAEDHPEILSKRIFLKPDATLKQNIVAEGESSVGKGYSLLEIADIMISDSDNNAALALLSETEESYVKGVFDSIGVPYEGTSKEANLRIKDYAGFFRVLYNASYLNRDMSEKALEILSHSKYKNGIVAGVPGDLAVAHKFGERSLVQRVGNQDVVVETQIHDCGIIYQPKTPYILCIMTRGKDMAVQEKTIQELSNLVYKEITD